MDGNKTLWALFWLWLLSKPQKDKTSVKQIPPVAVSTGGSAVFLEAEGDNEQEDLGV